MLTWLNIPRGPPSLLLRGLCTNSQRTKASYNTVALLHHESIQANRYKRRKKANYWRNCGTFLTKNSIITSQTQLLLAKPNICSFCNYIMRSFTNLKPITARYANNYSKPLTWDQPEGHHRKTRSALMPFQGSLGSFWYKKEGFVIQSRVFLWLVDTLINPNPAWWGGIQSCSQCSAHWTTRPPSVTAKA